MNRKNLSQTLYMRHISIAESLGFSKETICLNRNERCVPFSSNRKPDKVVLCSGGFQYYIKKYNYITLKHTYIERKRIL